LVEEPETVSVPAFMSEPGERRRAGRYSASIWMRGDEIWARFATGATFNGKPIIGIIDAQSAKVSVERLVSFLASLRPAPPDPAAG
jgi:hypothetical protein